METKIKKTKNALAIIQKTYNLTILSSSKHPYFSLYFLVLYTEGDLKESDKHSGTYVYFLYTVYGF